MYTDVGKLQWIIALATEVIHSKLYHILLEYCYPLVPKVTYGYVELMLCIELRQLLHWSAFIYQQLLDSSAYT